jgi:osmotically-inducible protein OsmY
MINKPLKKTTSLQNERNIMTINSIHSDRTLKIAESTGTPGLGQKLLKSKTVLWLALPLTLAVGCASHSPQAAGGDRFFPDTPAAVVTSDTSRHAANQTVADELFQLSLNDTAFEYSRVAWVNEGVITLRGPVPYNNEQYPDSSQRQTIDDGIMGLAGVNQVKDKLGVDTAPLVAIRAGN